MCVVKKKKKKKKSSFNIGLRSCTYEPICFKLGITVDSTKLYSLIPVCMTFTSTQGYGKVRTCAVILM